MIVDLFLKSTELFYPPQFEMHPGAGTTMNLLIALYLLSEVRLIKRSLKKKFFCSLIAHLIEQKT